MLFLRIRLYWCTVTLPICTITVYRCLNEWPLRASANGSFSVVDIESLAGLFQWVSIAWPAIIPSIASLQALKHSMKRSGIMSRCLDVCCKVVVIDLASFFLLGMYLLVIRGFSPVYLWDVLIKVDASTIFGMGGVCFPSFDCLIHEWLPNERTQALAHCSAPTRESTPFWIVVYSSCVDSFCDRLSW